MVLYFLLFGGALLLLYLLVQWLMSAAPQDIKKVLVFLAVVILASLGIMLFKYGAVIAGGVLVALPLLRRVWRMLPMLLALRKFKRRFATRKTQKMHYNTSADNNMSVKEAQEILGVDDSASKKEIKQAYITLMQKNHPDQGGSPYFAKKLNQAKEVLLKRKA